MVKWPSLNIVKICSKAIKQISQFLASILSFLWIFSLGSNIISRVLALIPIDSFMKQTENAKKKGELAFKKFGESKGKNE